MHAILICTQKTISRYLIHYNNFKFTYNYVFTHSFYNNLLCKVCMLVCLHDYYSYKRIAYYNNMHCLLVERKHQKAGSA